jgi:hypothetical protein
MRSLGEFVGHIVRAVKSDPARGSAVLNRSVEEERRGNVTLRRTTIEEIEVRPPPPEHR